VVPGGQGREESGSMSNGGGQHDSEFQWFAAKKQRSEKKNAVTRNKGKGGME